MEWSGTTTDGYVTVFDIDVTGIFTFAIYNSGLSNSIKYQIYVTSLWGDTISSLDNVLTADTHIAYDDEDFSASGVPTEAPPFNHLKVEVKSAGAGFASTYSIKGAFS